MKAVITVIGKDAVGILAKVSSICAESNANVIEVTQSVMQDMFAMIMLVDITKLSGDFSVLWETALVLRSTQCMRIFSIPCTVYNFSGDLYL